MKKKCLFLTALCAAAGISGCVNETVPWGYQCDEGAAVCNQNEVMKCVSGQWTIVEKCEGATPVCDPEQAVCVSDRDICTAGQQKCEQNIVFECQNNAWQIKQQCTSSQTCNPNSYTCDENSDQDDVCNKGETRCDGDALKTCGEDGQWSKAENLDCGRLETGTSLCGLNEMGIFSCLNETEVCAEGTTKCDGNTLLKCGSNGLWAKADKTECGTIDSSTPLCGLNSDNTYGCIANADCVISGADSLKHGQQTCMNADGSAGRNILVCNNGALELLNGAECPEGTTCTLPVSEDKDFTCEPTGCVTDAGNLSNGTSVCRGDQLYSCSESAEISTQDCAGLTVEHADRLLCNAEESPNVCDFTCMPRYKKSDDGSACVEDPNYTFSSADDIRKDFDHFVDQTVIEDSAGPDIGKKKCAVESSSKNYNVNINAYITAIEYTYDTEGNPETVAAVWVQGIEPDTSAIRVAHPQKKTGDAISDYGADELKVGDIININAKAVGQEGCQIQIVPMTQTDAEGSTTVSDPVIVTPSVDENGAETHEVKPIVVPDTGDLDIENPNSEYNGKLVIIEDAGHEFSKDSNYIYRWADTSDPRSAAPVENDIYQNVIESPNWVEHNNVTGIVTYNDDTNGISPRSDDDIVIITTTPGTDTETGENKDCNYGEPNQCIDEGGNVTVWICDKEGGVSKWSESSCGDALGNDGYNEAEWQCSSTTAGACEVKSCVVGAELSDGKCLPMNCGSADDMHVHGSVYCHENAPVKCDNGQIVPNSGAGAVTACSGETAFCVEIEVTPGKTEPACAACVPGSSSCTDDSVTHSGMHKTCDQNGSWSESVSCPSNSSHSTVACGDDQTCKDPSTFTCDEGFAQVDNNCIQKGSKCNADEWSCDAEGNARLCNADGTDYVESKVCADISAVCAGGLGCVECVPGSTSCSENSIKKCQTDGSWGTPDACPSKDVNGHVSCQDAEVCAAPDSFECDDGYTFEGGKCVQNGSVCKADTWSCFAEGAKLCNATGTAFIETQACTGNTPVCVAGAGMGCVQCAPESVSCTDGSIKTCGTDGTWGTAGLCASDDPNGVVKCADSTTCGAPGSFTCKPGYTKEGTKCVQNGSVCTADTWSCAAGSAKLCNATGTAFINTKICAGDTPVCVAGAGMGCVQCMPESTSCTGSSIKTCQANGSWNTSAPCPSDDTNGIVQCASDGLSCGASDSFECKPGYTKEGNKCVQNGSVCTPDTWSCEGGNAKLCNAAGTAFAETKVCSGSVPVCLPGKGLGCVQCDPKDYPSCKNDALGSGTVYSCSSDGKLTSTACSASDINGILSCNAESKACGAPETFECKPGYTKEGTSCVKNSSVCEPGSWKCTSANVYQQCNTSGTAYINTQTCKDSTPVCKEGTGCVGCIANESCGSDQVCNTTTNQCQSGKTESCDPAVRKCENDKIYTCDASGSGWLEDTNCAGSGKVCNSWTSGADIVCEEKCTETTSVCSGTQISTCDGTGHLAVPQDCAPSVGGAEAECRNVGGANQCVDTACPDTHYLKDNKCTPKQCTVLDTYRCTGQNVEKCVNYEWVQTKSCAGGTPFCIENANSSVAPVCGVCLPGTTTCTGTDITTCKDDGQWGAPSVCPAPAAIANAAQGTCSADGKTCSADRISACDSGFSVNGTQTACYTSDYTDKNEWCSLHWIDAPTATAYVHKPIATDAKLSVYCTTKEKSLTDPISLWTRLDSVKNKDLNKVNVEFMTAAGALPKDPAGEYVCVAVADLKNGPSYICQGDDKNHGTTGAIRFTPDTKLISGGKAKNDYNAKTYTADGSKIIRHWIETFEEKKFSEKKYIDYFEYNGHGVTWKNTQGWYAFPGYYPINDGQGIGSKGNIKFEAPNGINNLEFDAQSWNPSSGLSELFSGYIIKKEKNRKISISNGTDTFDLDCKNVAADPNGSYFVDKNKRHFKCTRQDGTPIALSSGAAKATVTFMVSPKPMLVDFDYTIDNVEWDDFY